MFFFGGVEVTKYLVRDAERKVGVSTDALLDTPLLSVFQTARCFLFLNNSENTFSENNSDNFFVSELSRDQHGWRTGVEVRLGFEDSEWGDDLVLFYGEIEEVKELPGTRWVRVMLLDKSGYLREAVIDDFGVEETVSRFSGADRSFQEGQLRDLLVERRLNLPVAEEKLIYKETVPAFVLPVSSLPISQGSVSGKIGDEEIEVLPVLPPEGKLANYLIGAMDLESGVFYFGGEPPEKENADFEVTYKAAYWYVSPEKAMYELANAYGVYDGMSDDQKGFARTLLESPILEHFREEVSLHGRPGADGHFPVVRWILPLTNGIYFGGDRYVFRYRRRTDTNFDVWTLHGTCPDTDAVILYMRAVGDVFYILTVSDFSIISRA